VAEVAEASEPRAPLLEDRPRHLGVEARRGKPVGALRHEELHNHGAGGGDRRGDEERHAPRQLGQAAHQVGRRRAHGECADQDADRQTPALAEPRRHHFHRGRIGARHRDTRDEAEREGGAEALDPERQRPVGDDAEDDARRHQRAG